jgi:ABC-type transport system involved in cytochrome c biogenesis permease component
MSLSVLAQPRVPRAAFGKIVRNEARLAWRQPSGLIVGVGISLALLISFGEIPVFRQSSASLGGLPAFDVYIPILIAFVIGVMALTYLPGPLVSYREQGILRRLSTTPVPPSWVLAAQMVVQACLMAISVALLIVVSVVFFGASAPKNPAGMVLAIALFILAMFAIGLSIAAAARLPDAAHADCAQGHRPLHPAQRRGRSDPGHDAPGVRPGGAAPGPRRLCGRVRLPGHALLQVGIARRAAPSCRSAAEPGARWRRTVRAQQRRPRCTTILPGIRMR